MLRTLGYHPKAVSWVLGKPFHVVTGPQALCEVRMDRVAGPLHILLAEQRGEDLVQYNMSQTLNLRELFDSVCLS